MLFTYFYVRGHKFQFIFSCIFLHTFHMYEIGHIIRFHSAIYIGVSQCYGPCIFTYQQMEPYLTFINIIIKIQHTKQINGKNPSYA